MLGQVKNQRFFANETMFGQSPQDRLLVQSDVAHSLILSDGTNRFPETVVDARTKMAAFWFVIVGLV